MKKILFTVAILSLSATGINAQNTYECKGFSMTGEGKMVCEYLDSYDKKTRHVFANISEDTVVYTVIRENPDKSLDMLKKWKVPISIVNASSPYFGVFHWTNGSEKIQKITLPIASGQSFLCQEFFCARSTQPQLVSISDRLDMSFRSEDEAKAFFEEVKAIRARVETPSGGGGSSRSGDKKLSGNIYIRNRSGADVYIKVEGGSAASKIVKNGSSSISCSAYPGKKVMLVTGDHKVLQTLFTVDEGMCKKGEYILGK